MSFDAVVVGAGAMGSALAGKLSARGLTVMVCDPRQPRRDATWAAAGMLCAQAEAAEPGPFLDLLLAAEERWSELAGRFDYQKQGALHVALSEEERAELIEQREWQRQSGLPVDFLEPEETRRLEPGLGPDIAGANFFARGGQVDNRALVSGFLAEAVGAGAVLRVGEVDRIVVEAGAFRAVVVGGERIDAGLAVVAAGAWSSRIAGLGLAADAVVPVRGQLLAYAVEPPPITRAVFGGGGYLLPRHGDRCIAGTTMERVGFESGVTTEGCVLLERRAHRLCPALDGVPVAESWAGLRPATADGLPALGPTPIEGLHLAVGLFRNGILLAPLASELVTRAIFGDGSAIPAPFAAARLFEAS